MRPGERENLSIKLLKTFLNELSDIVYLFFEKPCLFFCCFFFTQFSVPHVWLKRIKDLKLVFHNILGFRLPD